ncbi:hypothetical protein [Luteimonas vadosa]
MRLQSSLRSRRILLVAMACLAGAGCAHPPSAAGLTVGSEATVDGTIASVDTQPWSYDGNAEILLDTATHGRVSVHLPARWNLCQAPPIDVEALSVGRRAQAVGTVTAADVVVVCERPEHRLLLAD